MTARTIRRARPLLGAFVRIEAVGDDLDLLERAVAAAFAEVAAVHAAMSFQEPESELSALNAAEAGAWLALSPAMARVLQIARSVARASNGAFDPVVAAERAVSAGALPRPKGRAADPGATWRDLEPSDDEARVRFARPLWIDLGGVAKGFAVDRAVEALQRGGVASGWIDAGGDRRGFGAPHAVALDARAPHAPVPRLDLTGCALASSGGLAPREGLAAQAHIDGRDGRDTGKGFAAVVAASCAVADALTKVVLALGREAAPVLDPFDAHGYHLAPGRNWTVLGAEPT